MPSAFSAFLASLQYPVVVKEGCNCRSTVSVSPVHVKVSILTRPGGRVQRCSRVRITSHTSVSILTRPGGRVQRCVEVRDTARRACFNPHPSRGTGATRLGCLPIRPIHVSILTRPGGRVQPDTLAETRFLAKFQSSPVPGDGCNARIAFWLAQQSFVSILTRPGGRVQQGKPIRVAHGSRVSILTRPGGRVQRSWGD